MPVEDIFPSGVEERVVHAHLPSRDRTRHGVVDLLVRDLLPKVAVSSAMLVVVSATWPETAQPLKVTPGEASVECHE